MPRVSILIPLYDGREFIGACLAALQAQTFEDWEALVVDDGSHDDGPELVAELARRDARIRLLRQANAHTQAARNAALAEARGEWAALLDQDDLWLAEKLARQMALADAEPRANLLFCDSRHWDGARLYRYRFGPGTTLPHGDVRRALVFRCLFTASTVVVRTADARAVGGFDPRFPRTGDHDLWLRLAERGLFVAGVPDVLVHYRVWSGNVSRDLERMAEEGIRLHEWALARQTDARGAAWHRRALTKARAHLALTRALLGFERPEQVSAPAVLRIWAADRREVKWLARGAVLGWPRFLGGKLVQHVTRRRLFAKAKTLREGLE
jgi:glycosyltransferase involved in cell wall biosynthesis